MSEDPRHELARISALDLVGEQIKSNNVLGAVAELGVNKGRFARFINKVFPDRKIYLFDTFEGFSGKDIENPIDNFDISDNAIRWLYDDVKDTSVTYVLSRLPHPEQAIIRKGWFPDTAEGFQDDDRFAFVSIDTDLYDPTYSGLVFFYPHLSNGGYIFVHDYNCGLHPGVKKAVDLFCRENNLTVVPLPDRSGTAVLAKRSLTFTREVLLHALTGDDAFDSD
jgi:O-methyltransferase